MFAGGYIFPATAELPQLSFAIGDQFISLDKATLSYGEQDQDGNVFGAIQSSGNSGLCIMGGTFFHVSLFRPRSRGVEVVALIQVHFQNAYGTPLCEHKLTKLMVLLSSGLRRGEPPDWSCSARCVAWGTAFAHQPKSLSPGT